MQSAGRSWFGTNFLLFAFISWFLLNLSSLKYNFRSFLTYPPSGRTGSRAGACCPGACSRRGSAWAENGTVAEARSRTAQRVGRVALGKETTFFRTGKCFQIYVRLAVESMENGPCWKRWDVESVERFCPFACSICSKSCLYVPEK